MAVCLWILLFSARLLWRFEEVALVYNHFFLDPLIRVRRRATKIVSPLFIEAFRGACVFVCRVERTNSNVTLLKPPLTRDDGQLFIRLKILLLYTLKIDSSDRYPNSQNSRRIVTPILRTVFNFISRLDTHTRTRCLN